MSKYKKILIISYYYKPDLSAGSFRSVDFVSELKTQLPDGYTVDVLTTMPNRYASFSAHALEFEQLENINIYRINTDNGSKGHLFQLKSFLNFYVGALEIVKRNKYDLVFATTSRLLTGFLGARCAVKNKAPLFLDVRDLFVDTLKSILSPHIYYPVFPIVRLIEWYTFRHASLVNIVSPGFKKDIDSVYSGPVTLFSNGIDEEFLDYDFSKKEVTNKSLVVYAGNIGKGQELHLLVPDLAKLTEDTHEFVIIGDGGSRKLLINKLKRAAIQNVRVLEPVPRAELLTWYRRADILFLHLDNKPAFTKVLPSKMFEYAATGKPILAGVAGCAADFLEKIDGALVFEPSNAVDAFVKIRSFTDNSVYNREAFVTEYSRSRISQHMVKRFLGLLA